MRRLLSVLFVFVIMLSPMAALADARAIFIDADQADATLVVCDGEAMLIDTGLVKHGKRVESALDSEGVTSLKYLVTTHPHADNIGNVPEILAGYDVGTLLLPAIDHDTKAYKKMADAIKDSGVKTVNPYAGDAFKLGGATIAVYAPCDNDYSDINDWSITLRLEYAGRSVLFCADGEARSEADMLAGDDALPLKSDVLRVALHGSDAASDADFLRAVSPRIAVIACNKEGYPHPDTAARLIDAGVEDVITTGEMGDICVDITESGELTYYSYAG